MQFYRCRCGKSKSWGSIPPANCVACGECGVTLAQSPDGHAEPAPHEYVTVYDRHTGAPHQECTRCRKALPSQETVTKPAPQPGP